MKKLKRREFIRRCAGVAASLGAGRLIGGCGNGNGGNGEDGGSDGGVDTRTPVAAVRGGDLTAMTRQALESLGGFGPEAEPLRALARYIIGRDH